MSSTELSTHGSRFPKLRWSTLERQWQVGTGGCLLAVLLVIALTAPWIAPYDATSQDLLNTLQPPSLSEHWLGTDELGRDVFSRMLMGARVSLAVGLLTALLSICIGVPFGLVSGYFGGRADLALGRLIDAVLAIPSLLLALGLAAVFGPSLGTIVIALGSVWWASYARIVRGEALGLKATQFVEAGRSIGCSNGRIIFKYLLPNVVPIVMALAALTVASGIIVEASLSFLGVGTQPPTPSWGAMLSTGRNYLRTAWWLSAPPGIAIVVTILALNLLGDGLRDIADPKLRR